MKHMKRQMIITGAFFAALAVAFGAFGAHWLKTKLGPVELLNFETAVRYQMYHALAILFLAVLARDTNLKQLRFPFYAFTLGTLFFSGSIYFLATRSLTGLSAPWIGPVTPLGGLLFISGWIYIIYLYTSKKAV
jgi:uncharacterized membrane protein YgdD (TMEM256/DUF423 family)